MDYLFEAIENNDLKVLEKFIETGGNVNKPIKNKIKLLNKAVHVSNLQIVELLVKHEAKLKNYHLFTAIKNDEFEMVNLFLQKKAKLNINVQNRKGQTFLYCAVKHNKNIEIIQLLFKYGADANICDENVDYIPLCEAIRKNKYEFVKIILENGANVRYSCNGGVDSFLHAAVDFNANLDIIKLLVKYKCDLYSFDDCDSTPFARLIEKNHKNIEIAKFFLECGYNINYRSPGFRFTLLHYAVIYKNANMIQFLIENGANINIKNYQKQTPFLYAKKQKFKKIMYLLYKYVLMDLWEL